MVADDAQITASSGGDLILGGLTVGFLSAGQVTVDVIGSTLTAMMASAVVTNIGSAGYSAPEREKPWSVPYVSIGFKNSDIDDQGQIKPGAPKGQLYDLSKDLAQSKNIAPEHPERVASMRAQLEELTGKPKVQAQTE